MGPFCLLGRRRPPCRKYRAKCNYWLILPQTGMQLIFSCMYAIVIHMTDTPTSSILSIRVNPDERAILEAAAEQSRTTLSDFMRRKALEAAEVDVLGRTIVTIPAKDWEQFEAWLGAPAATVPALKKLGGVIPSWDR